MTEYLINKCKYVIRDFTFAELAKVQQIRKELAPDLFSGKVENSVTVDPGPPERIAEILSFILEDVNGGSAVIGIEDINNTGMKMLSNVLRDFVIGDLLILAEKKRYSESLMKELSDVLPSSKHSQKSIRNTSRPR